MPSALLTATRVVTLSSARAVTVTLYPAPTNRGRVVDGAGEPAAGAKLYIDESPWDERAPLGVTSGADGTFAVDTAFVRGWDMRAHIAAFHERGVYLERLRTMSGSGLTGSSWRAACSRRFTGGWKRKALPRRVRAATA